MAQASPPEAELAEFVRSLDAESFGDLLNVLAMMKFTEFNAAGGDNLNHRVRLLGSGLPPGRTKR